MAVPTVRFLELRIARLTVAGLLDFVRERIEGREGRPATIGYVNAHTSNLAASDHSHRGLMQRMSLLYADGMAVVWAARRLGTGLPERVNAGDFLPRLLWMARARGWRVAIVGGDEEMIELAARRLTEMVPGLEFALVHHGYFAPRSADEKRVIQLLDAAKVDLVLVGMGSPRQEQFTQAIAAKNAAKVVWCVGALFEYYSGTRARAPVWMRMAGLEWLFRLALEPKRLAARYLWGNLRFAWRVISGGK